MKLKKAGNTWVQEWPEGGSYNISITHAIVPIGKYFGRKSVMKRTG